MKIRAGAFNTYLLLVAMLVIVGCQTNQAAKGKASARKEKKELSTLGLHLEMFADGSDRTQTIRVHRDTPVTLTVETKPCLDEGEIERASVVDSMDTYVLRIEFSRRGAWLLENLTASNIGKRLAVASQFGEARWLAAPVINRRIADGVFFFAPDASREEAERIARGLNNMVVKNKKKWTF